MGNVVVPVSHHDVKNTFKLIMVRLESIPRNLALAAMQVFCRVLAILLCRSSNALPNIAARDCHTPDTGWIECPGPALLRAQCCRSCDLNDSLSCTVCAINSKSELVEIGAMEGTIAQLPGQREYMLQMLPAEAVVFILEGLGFRDLMALRMTCKTLCGWLIHATR